MITSRQMRALEKNSQFYGVSTLSLMKNAGKAVADIAGKRKPKKVLVFCGTGNNGGDGIVAGSLLSEKTEVHIILLGKREKIKHFEARTVCLDIRKAKLHEIDDPKDLVKILPLLSDSDLIIDALLGTGIVGVPNEPIKSAISMINKAKAYTISVDLPSGLDPDTGKGRAVVKPDLTVTFHDRKPGLKGRAEIADIGIPKKAITNCGPGDLSLALKKPEPKAHKGYFGKVLVVGGSKDLVGAPFLSAYAALRLGADISAVASVEEVSETINSYSPDIITYKLCDEDCLTVSDLEKALKLSEKFDSVVLGPGISLDSIEFSRSFFAKCKKPIVVDADAIKALSEWIKPGPEKIILTPHAKEYEILAGKAKPQSFAKEKGVTILLKGPEDLVTDGVHEKRCDLGNPRMAVGGTGDVLSGICGLLLAQSGDPFLSASGASFLNKRAGDLLKEEKGRTFIASEIPDIFHRIIADL